MKGNECLKWMKEEGIYEIAEKHYKRLSKVFRYCLATKKDECMLIIADTGLKGNNLSAILSLCYYLYAKEKGLKVSIVMQESKKAGEDAGEDVKEALFNIPPYSIIITNLSNKLGRIKGTKSFRKYCRSMNLKFVTTSSLGYIPNEYIVQLMNMLSIDYIDLRRRQNRLKIYLDRGKELVLKTDKGTNLKFDISEYEGISADGDFRQYGKGGNLPAGEVYISPVEGKIDGTLVIDASSRNSVKTELIRDPIKMKIKKGVITKIEGGIEADLLDQSLKEAEERAKYPERIRKICELGIGTNSSAKVIGTTIIDEKAFGTAHVAMGSNSWFGGTIKTIIHLDQVLHNPKIFIDGKELKVK